MEKNIILETDDNAAKFVENISGWVSANGNFYGNLSSFNSNLTSEQLARCDGATHRKCNGCGAIIPKHYINCSDCSEKINQKKFDELDKIEWDGKASIYSNRDDWYFHNVDELLDYCEDIELSNENHFSELQLYLCQKINIPFLDYMDYYSNAMNVDVDELLLPSTMLSLLELVNSIAKETKTDFWEPTKQAVTYNIGQHI